VRALFLSPFANPADARATRGTGLFRDLHFFFFQSFEAAVTCGELQLGLGARINIRGIIRLERSGIKISKMLKAMAMRTRIFWLTGSLYVNILNLS
jgi:hypothetical protein